MADKTNILPGAGTTSKSSTAAPINDGLPQTSQAVPVIIPAATVDGFGQLQPSEQSIAFPGKQFYILAASNPVTIAPFRGGAIQLPTTYSVGQGRKVESGFDQLKVVNRNTFPINALVWVGFDDFINDQLVLVNSSYSQIINPTYNGVAPATTIAIPDLSGQTFFDVNGKKWAAISRVAILLFNTSTGTSYNLQGSGAATATGPAVAQVNGGQPIRIDAGGNYSINIGGAAIPAIVSEIYNAFPAS